MGRIAFVFPGQGAQYPGMGMQISSKYPSSDAVFDEASDALGFDVRKLVFEGSSDDLKITENTQPAVLTASIACLQPLLETGIKPYAVAGLSLGEYSAHVAAGTLSFRDTAKLVRKRGKFMKEAVPEGVGTMAAILGLENNTVIECCREASKFGVVEPANFNCPGQVVIAGEIDAVGKAISICIEKGAKRAMLLQVSAPFHCSLMKPAGKRLSEELDKIALGLTEIPVVTNVEAEYLFDNARVKELLIRQVSSPVLWEDSIRKMISDGVDRFIEIGPGKILCGFIKKISKDVFTYNVEDIESLEKTIAELAY